MRFILFFFLVLAGFKACSYVHAAENSFHLESDDLSLALNDYSRQSGLQVLFDFAATAGLRSHTVQCECENSVALGNLLESTGMCFDFVNDRTLAVVPESQGDCGIRFDSDGLRRALRGFRFVDVAQSYGTERHIRPAIKVFSVLPSSELQQ